MPSRHQQGRAAGTGASEGKGIQQWGRGPFDTDAYHPHSPIPTETLNQHTFPTLPPSPPSLTPYITQVLSKSMSDNKH